MSSFFFSQYSLCPIETRGNNVSQRCRKESRSQRANSFRAPLRDASTHFAHAGLVRFIFSRRLNRSRVKRYSLAVCVFRSAVRQSPAAAAARPAYRRALRRRAIRQEDIHHPNIMGGAARLGAVPANAVQECQCSVHGKTSSSLPAAQGRAQNCPPRSEPEQVQR